MSDRKFFALKANCEVLHSRSLEKEKHVKQEGALVFYVTQKDIKKQNPHEVQSTNANSEKNQAHP
jgi:hypothetical protein